MPTAETEVDLEHHNPPRLGGVDEDQLHHSAGSGCAILDSGEECEEPPRKRGRTTNSFATPRERNKYKGMRIRQCLCGLADCLPRLKGWIDLNDSKRQGFKELPRQPTKQTPVGLEKNRVRDIMFLHLKGHKSPIYAEADKTNRERKLFVAFHHFHPAMLQEGNKGPYQYINLELAERIGGFGECDTVQNLPGIVFHPIPSYPRELADRDFETAGGIAKPRNVRHLWPASLSMPSRKSTASPAYEQAEKQDSQAMRHRVRDVLVQMERDPLKVANEFLQMKERLRQYDEMMAMEQQQQQQHNHQHVRHAESEIDDAGMENDHDAFTGDVVNV